MFFFFVHARLDACVCFRFLYQVFSLSAAIPDDDENPVVPNPSPVTPAPLGEGETPAPLGEGETPAPVNGDGDFSLEGCFRDVEDDRYDGTAVSNRTDCRFSHRLFNEVWCVFFARSRNKHPSVR